MPPGELATAGERRQEEKVGGTIYPPPMDGDSPPRKRLDNNGTIHYLGGYERNVGNGVDATEVVTKYYAASFGKLGRLIAFRKAGLLYFVGTDHLGSTIRVADAGFVAMDQMRYSPFGSSRDAGMSLKTDHKYTGQIEDQSIGWYWYRSRAYDPALGRFLCPDSIVPEAGNPQALNRYAYTRNNPLRNSDPSGHDIADWFNDSWLQEFAAAHPDQPNPTIDDYVYRFVTMAWSSQMPLGDLGFFAVPSAKVVNIQEHVDYAESISLLMPPLGAQERFIQLVMPYGKWDYKHRYDVLGDHAPYVYEPFGNFLFGIVARAFGFSEEFSLRGAGWAQYGYNRFAAVVSPLVDLFGKTDLQPTAAEGAPWDGPPYGDSPEDQERIKFGMAVYDAYRAHNPLSLPEQPWPLTISFSSY